MLMKTLTFYFYRSEIEILNAELLIADQQLSELLQNADDSHNGLSKVIITVRK